MSTTTATSEKQGLPQGGKLSDGEPPEGAAPRRGDELFDAAAGGDRLTQEETTDLLDYFLSNDGLPGDGEPVPMRVTVDGRTDVWRLKKITWDEYQDNIDRAMVGEGDERRLDTYIAASWHVARALVHPKLGPAVLGMQKRNAATAPRDAAEMLRRMFEEQSGILLELGAEVLRMSKLVGSAGAVKVLDREIDAGKR